MTSKDKWRVGILAVVELGILVAGVLVLRAFDVAVYSRPTSLSWFLPVGLVAAFFLAVVVGNRKLRK